MESNPHSTINYPCTVLENKFGPLNILSIVCRTLRMIRGPEPTYKSKILLCFHIWTLTNQIWATHWLFEKRTLFFMWFSTETVRIFIIVYYRYLIQYIDILLYRYTYFDSNGIQRTSVLPGDWWTAITLYCSVCVLEQN